VPKINFQAKDYCKLIDSSDIIDPPILSHLHATIIQEKVSKNDFSFIDDFASHTQSVERCVKLVTEAASYVCGSENRDKAIRSKLLARAINPKIQNKKKLI